MADLEADLKSLLTKISRKLSKGGISSDGNARNFSARIELFSGDQTAGSEALAIRQILGYLAVVDIVSRITWAELSNRVNDCLSWQGWDEHSQPNRRYQLSTEFSKDTTEVSLMLGELFENAVGIWEFELTSGHPFYPVYWDFAFLIKNPNRDYVFIGSSSD